VVYFAASVDDVETNTKFAESLGADFPILSDADKKVAAAYGVLRPDGGVSNRWTYYVGPDGKVLAVDKQIDVKTAGADIAKKLAELGVAKAE
jgi:peroxiredoxin Q/BCP